MNDQTTTTGTASPLKRSVLKGKARASLLGHYMPLSSAFLSLAILQYIITAPSGLIQVHPPFGTILYYAVTFAISVFFGIFQVGITGLFLSNSCHQPVYAGGIFSGFWHEPLKAIQIQLVLSLLLCIPEIVPSLLFSLYLQSGRVNMVYLYAAAGISIVFLPFVLYIKTLYSQVFFIMLFDCLYHFLAFVAKTGDQTLMGLGLVPGAAMFASKLCNYIQKFLVTIHKPVLTASC